jgi:hypothetical protein
VATKHAKEVHPLMYVLFFVFIIFLWILNVWWWTMLHHWFEYYWNLCDAGFVKLAVIPNWGGRPIFLRATMVII